MIHLILRASASGAEITLVRFQKLWTQWLLQFHPDARCKGRVEQRSQLVFLLLILAQAAHSIEEYVTGLYQVFAPARFVNGLVSNNLPLGFLVFNTGLVAFGLWCWAVPVRSGWAAATGLAWFWIILELGNGIGHCGLALRQGSYFPGLITAPLLLLFASWLAVLQIRDARLRAT
jgi:hypothetical protein